MNYLKLHYGITNPGEVTWAHAVNSREKLEAALSDPFLMMIESDIRISPLGIPVAVHPPETESDLRFDYLIHQIRTSKKGLKLDFKDPEALIPCLQLLEELQLEQPVILNADILQGNNADISKFSPEAFLALSKKYNTSAMLSVGWTTLDHPSFGYTQQNINEMREFVKLHEEITYPVRATLLPNSLQHLSLLTQQEGHTLTIWNHEPVSKELGEWIKSNTDPDKTFYDFIYEGKAR